MKEYGYSKEDLIGKNILDFIHPDDREKAVHRINERRTGDRSTKSLEIRLLRKDFTYAHLEDKSRGSETFSIDAEGIYSSGKSEIKKFFAGTQGIARDIFERKMAQDALRDSEELNRNLLELLPEAIFVHQEGKIVYINSAGAAIFAAKHPSDLIGKPISSLIPRSYHKIVRSRVDKIYREREILPCKELKYKRLDKKVIDVEATGTSIDYKGKQGVLSVIRDITKRKKAEERLKESDEYHRSLFESSPTALYLQDFTEVEKQVNRLKAAGVTEVGRYLRENPEKAFQLSRSVVFSNANKAAVDLYKAGTKRNLLGSLDRVIIKDDLQHFIDPAIALTDGEDSWPGEARNYNLQKEIMEIVIRKGVINRQANGVSKVLVSINDVTALNKAHKSKELLETQLHQAKKMEAIGTLAGGVAHDLNNILGGLVSYPELLLLQLPADSPLRKSILTIQKSGEKAAAVVQDLLTLARRGVVITEVVPLNDVISEYLKSPEHEMLQSYHPGVQIETHLKKDTLNILGSSTHLSKAVMNLISNGAEAMPEGGTLSASTENRYIDRPVRGHDQLKEGDYVVLTISDTGTGISQDDIEKIFEPFYTKKKMGRSGTGLGMAVVWGTVKDHNGYINVQSTEGKGTTFTIYFPVTRKTLPEDKSHLPIESYSGSGESILIVDDVEEQRKIITGMLKELGYSVVSVSSGEEAVEYLKTSKVDLLVLDMIMDPGMDGLDTYKRILGIHPGQKAIIASGFSVTDRVKEVKNLGAGTYIRKPVLLEKLGVAVKEELENYHKN